MNKRVLKQRQQIVNKLFSSKKEFHKLMAKLPFDEKLRMLSELREFVKVVKGKL